MSLLSLSVLLAVQVPAGEPASTQVVRVLEEGRPVAGAEVELLSRDDAEAAGFEAGRLDDWEAARAAHALRARTDERGSARLPRPEGGFLVCASAPGLWAQEWIQAEAVEETTLVLEPDTMLAVLVVDASGAPRPDVPVAFRSGAEVAPEDHFLHAWTLRVSTTDAEGVARFAHVQVSAPREGAVLFVGLELPLAAPVERRIALAGSLTTSELELPETGSLAVAWDGGDGLARLRRTADAAWRHEPAPTARIVGGRAVFPHVGLGLELDVEVSAPGLSLPAHQNVAGPRHAGERVELRLAGPGRALRLRGRALDTQGNPLGPGLSFLVTSTDANSNSWGDGGPLPTSADGRFALYLPPDERPAVRRELTLWLGGLTSRRYDLAAAPATGPFDLGNVGLFDPDDPEWLRALDDDALDATWAELRLEICLIEMARRGGTRWTELLRREIARLSGPDLALRIALRRAQRRADPVVLETSVLESSPDGPLVRAVLRNVDPEPIRVAVRGGYQSGRFERCHVEAQDPGGRALPPLDPPSPMGGGLFQYELVQPGREVQFDIRPGDYVAFPAPGTYHLRLHYHDEEAIDGADGLRGRLVVSSAWFPVTVAAAAPR